MSTRISSRWGLALVVLTLINAIWPLATQARPIEVWHYTVVSTNPPNPGSGWSTVTQLLTSSGCSGTSCGSNWQPRNSSFTILLEKTSDRVYKGHGAPDGTPPYNAAVVYDRERCPTDGAWGAGTWHHNFQAESRLEQTDYREILSEAETHVYVTLTQRWSSNYYQSFAHNDACFSGEYEPYVPTPTPPAGGGILPTPAPPAPPGTVRVSVQVSVSGTPPSPGSAAGSGGGDYVPGAGVRATANYPSSWDDSPTWQGISYDGCGQSGSSWEVEFSAPASDCTLTFSIQFSDSGTPGPEPPSEGPPCDPDYAADTRPVLEFRIPGVTSYAYARQSGQDGTLPPSQQPAWAHPVDRVRPGQQLAITFDLLSLERHPDNKLAYQPDHYGTAHIAFGLRDLTTGEELVSVDTVDRKELATISGEIIYWNRTLQISRAIVSPNTTFSGPMQYSLFDRMHDGGWVARVSMPSVNRFLAPDLAPSTVLFTPLSGHRYEVWSQAGHGCMPYGVKYQRWMLARFQAGEMRTVSGQIWDITDSDAPVPATQGQQEVRLEGMAMRATAQQVSEDPSENVTAPLYSLSTLSAAPSDGRAAPAADAGDFVEIARTRSSSTTGAFAIPIDSAALEAFLRKAGYPNDFTQPITFRLRFTPTAPYYPTDRAAEPPDGMAPVNRNAFETVFSIPPADLIARDHDGAAFYVTTNGAQVPVESRLFGWVRSPHDGANSPFYSTKDNATSTAFSWTYGGIAEFYPDVAVEIPLAFAAQGYRVEAQVTGWRFRGSPPLDAGVDQALAYEQPVQVLWSKYPPEHLQAPAVYAYRISRVDKPVALSVVVDYRYAIVGPDGTVVGAPIPGSIAGQFSIGLVTTQVLQGEER